MPQSPQHADAIIQGEGMVAASGRIVASPETFSVYTHVRRIPAEFTQ